MALQSNHGRTKVGGSSLPAGGGSLNKSTSKVASGKARVIRASAGKSLGGTPAVKLGTFHGNHNVAHATKGSSYATKRGVPPQMGNC